MSKENVVRQALAREISSDPLPELHLPSLDPKLALHQSGLERRQAIIDLGLKQINSNAEQIRAQLEWGELAEEKEKLKKLFLDSNKIVKENRASISRFCEIIREQKSHKVRLEREILYTQIDIEDYKKVKETMEKYVAQYSIFENFLENVAAESKTGDLLSVRDILNRYETLEGTRADLTRILAAEMEAEAQLRKQMIQLLEDKSATLKTLSNRLVMLQVTRRQAMDRRIYWEMLVQRIKNMILVRQEESVVLRGACWDLYSQTCSRRRAQPTAAVHDMEAQLDYIQKNIMFYKEVLTMATGGTKNVRDKKIVAKRKKKV